MKGDKTTFKKDASFYKQYSDNEYKYLKMLHDYTELPITTENNYIKMSYGKIISIDDIPKEKRHQVKHIITKNLDFILSQIAYISKLGISYNDTLQFLYYNKKLYLIDFDIATTEDDAKENNYNLLYTFLKQFNINSSFINESMYYLELFKYSPDAFLDISESDIELYNKKVNPATTYNHVYYSSNSRHIQITEDIEYIHVYGKTGNIIITEKILNEDITNEYELIRIY